LTAGERRLGAIMFTGLVGYYSFTSPYEARSLKMPEENRAFIQVAFQKHGNVDVESVGDGFLLYLKGFPYLARYRSDPRWSAIDSELGPS
jgi:hypothetical protein